MATPIITVQNIIDLIQDYCRNASLFTQNSSKVYRAINTAADFVFSQAGLPSQERTYTFDFDADQITYILSEDFGEPISLRYNDDVLNRHRRFTYKPVELLYERAKSIGQDTRLWSVDASSGSWRLWVLAQNSTASLNIDSFDYNNAAVWNASNDAVNVADDTNVYKEGGGALKFDISVGASGLDRATLTKTVSLNLKQYIDIGHFKVWAYLPNITNLTSISFTWQSSAGNYYKQTVTTQADGSAFVVGWNHLDFQWLGAVVVGSPDATNITTIKFDFDYTSAYTGGVNYRLDALRLSVPDKMVLTYYTRYKGKNNSGQYIYDFSATNDQFLFGGTDTLPKNLIALRASIGLMPQLLQDNKFIQQEYEYHLSIMRKKYPRKRVNNLLLEPLMARTD